MLLRKLVRRIKEVREVSTWSPLATSFNSKGAEKHGFKLSGKQTVSMKAPNY